MATETKITLKLLVDRNTKKVLYAEAKKDFVDFLFGLLQIPIGSIINLLKQNNISASGSFGRVLNSVQELESAHFHSDSHKQNILSPKLAVSYGNDQTPLLLKNFAAFEDKNSGHHYSSYSYSSYGSSSSPQQAGYVKDFLLTYMVTDDLVVKSMSTISTFSLLQTFGVTDIESLQEKNVEIDFKKGLELVKAALVSDTVLTDVFTSSKGNRSRSLHGTLEEDSMFNPMNNEEVYPLRASFGDTGSRRRNTLCKNSRRRNTLCKNVRVRLRTKCEFEE